VPLRRSGFPLVVRLLTGIRDNHFASGHLPDCQRNARLSLMGRVPQ
jgi:hypothetical protein